MAASPHASRPGRPRFGRLSLLALLLPLLAAGPVRSLSLDPLLPLPGPGSSVPGSGEVLLRLQDDDPTGELLRAVLEAFHLTELAGTPRLRQNGWIRARSDLSQSLASLLAALRLDPRVRDALPNLVVIGATNDPYWPRQWNLRALGLPSAWSGQSHGDGVLVAVLDTGLSPGPDLDPSLVVPGHDFFNGDSDPADDHQHGTMMASMLASSVGNGHAVAGVAPGVRLLPVKVLGAQRLGTTAALVEGLYFAAEQGAEVVNLSLSYPPGAYPGAVLDEALDALSEQGVVLLAAAGNEGSSSVSYPAAHPGVIAIGASEPLDGFSGLTRAAYSGYGSALDLLAPGGAARDVDGDGRTDAVLGETLDPQTGAFGVWLAAGSSGAAAQASGAAALLLARGATPAEVRSALEAGAADAGAAGFDAETGVGFLDLAAALEYPFGPLDPGATNTVSTVPDVHVELREELVPPSLADPALGLLRAVATVEVREPSGGAPLAGVWVYGHFAGASGRNAGQRTDAQGRAVFASAAYRPDWRLLAGLTFAVDRVVESDGNPFDSEAETAWLSLLEGELWLISPEGQSWLMTPAGSGWLMTPAGSGWLISPEGQSWLMTPAGSGWLMTPAGSGWLMTPAGSSWLMTPAGSSWLMTPAGSSWLMTPAGSYPHATPAD